MTWRIVNCRWVWRPAHVWYGHRGLARDHGIHFLGNGRRSGGVLRHRRHFRLRAAWIWTCAAAGTPLVGVPAIGWAWARGWWPGYGAPGGAGAQGGFGAGGSGIGAGQVIATPEPSSLALLAGALVLMAVIANFMNPARRASGCRRRAAGRKSGVVTWLWVIGVRRGSDHSPGAAREPRP